MINSNSPTLKFQAVNIQPGASPSLANFIVEIIDEATLRTLETRYPKHNLKFDGGRVFTMSGTIELKGAPDHSPEFWKMINEQAPEIVSRHILQRLKGES